MTAAVLHGKEDVRVEEVPLPAAGPGEVRVRIEAALTCGTDVKVYKRGYHARMITPPAIFGHEFAGTIDEVGEGVEGWRLGDRVCAANSAPCGECGWCQSGREELCEDLLFLNGAYAQYITVPGRIVQRNLLKVPQQVSMSHAALAEPLACVLNGLRKLPVSAGDNVAVIGLGPIGLLFVYLSSLAGAKVAAAGRGGQRLRAAAELGASTILDAAVEPDLVASIRNATGCRANRVFECVGTSTAWETAIGACGRGGAVNLFGGCERGTKLTLDAHRLHYDEITVIGSFHHTPALFREALEMIYAHERDLCAIVNAEAPLRRLPEVLALAASGGGAIKTLIIP
ncbi:MAG TPA: alcohol dehydrogenase catalytic domain-containing protein [Chthonomonadales bacterium]|nr:alcohol dehydrogenase catalytic domain-containing protein [Chthonomonadales bacterium]